MKIVLQGGRIVDPSQGLEQVGDLVVEDGVISGVSAYRGASGDEVINVEGCVVCPGLIDMHVHLREPGYEYKEDIESGALAAAAGGFTAVCCMPNTNPPIDNPSVVEYILRRAKEKAYANVLPIVSLTKGMGQDQLSDIAELKAAGAVAVSDDAYPIQNAETMRRGMEYCSQFDLPLFTHNEDKTLTQGGAMNEGFVATVMGAPGIPAISEDIAAWRNILLSGLTGCRLHLLHISTAGTVEALRYAKSRNLPVTGETAPHYWTLTDKACEGYETNAKMNPPLRTRKDIEAIKAGLKDGSIDAIATDHAPHAINEKECEFDKAMFGIIGLETSLALANTHLVREGILSISEMIMRMSTAPARILGLRSGSLREGFPANVTVFDPDERWIVNPAELHSKSKNTPFAGMKLYGKTRFTLLEGKLIDLRRG